MRNLAARNKTFQWKASGFVFPDQSVFLLVIHRLWSRKTRTFKLPCG